MGQALDGRALGHGHWICKTILIWIRDVADSSLILEISMHILDKFGKQVLKHGIHSRIEEVPGTIDVVGTLETEFRSQPGRIMVSRKSRLPC